MNTTACSSQTSCLTSSTAIPVKRTEKGSADFFIEQIFTGCLAEYSYYLESEGESIIIDPIYDHELYLELASQRGTKIKYIFETHFHADFVSGHIELAIKTGATIVFGPLSEAKFDFHLAKDQETFKFGKAQLQVIHTPGHTLESSCFLLKDSNGVAHSVYTGDTLFLNEVGRPDLAANGDLHPEDLAKMLYDSIRNKIMLIPDEVFVFPGHGAGSPCGKSIGKGDFSTIGEQKLTNYAMMKDLNKEDFVKIASSDLPRPLPYMPYDVGLNKGYAPLRELEEIKRIGKKSFEEFHELLKNQKDITILDTRDNISEGLIEGSINIALKTTFSIFSGTLIQNEHQIFLIAEDQSKTEESIIRLLRVGYDKVIGYLDGGFKTWVKNGGKLYSFQAIEADKFLEIYQKSNKINIIDVRNKNEWKDGILDGAKLISLRDLTMEILKGNLDSLKNETVYLHCRSGPRALIAFSIMKKFGFSEATNILGGSNRMKELGFKFIIPNI